MPNIEDAVAVGRLGNRFILADRNAYTRGDVDCPVQIHDIELGKKGPVVPYQVLFKWGAWEKCGDDEYQVALKTINEREV